MFFSSILSYHYANLTYSPADLAFALGTTMQSNLGNYVAGDQIIVGLVIATQDNVTQTNLMQIKYTLTPFDFQNYKINKVFGFYSYDGPNGVFQNAVYLYNTGMYFAFGVISRQQSPLMYTDFITQIYAKNQFAYSTVKYNLISKKLQAKIYTTKPMPAGSCSYYIAFKHPYITSYGISFEGKYQKAYVTDFSATYGMNDLNKLFWDGYGWKMQIITNLDSTTFFQHFPFSPIITANCYTRVVGQINKVQIATHYQVKDILML